MEIKQKENGNKGSFYIEENGKTLAEMTYVKSGAGRIIIDHTEVDEALKGKGAGKQLVEKAVAFARQHGLKILPLCPFAASVFEKTPAYADVLS